MSNPATQHNRRSALAAELILASTQTERNTLLVNNPDLVDLRLANHLKNLCYESWTSEPTVARRAASALTSIGKRCASPEMKAILYWTRGISDITKGRLETAIKNLARSAELFQAESKTAESAQSKVAMLIALAMLGRYEEAVRVGNAALKIFLKTGDELAAGKIELNLSNIAARRDRHRESEKLCLSAMKRFARLGEYEWQTMAENGLANTYSEIGELRKADKYYRSALQKAYSAGMQVTQAEIEASVGNLARSRGQYTEALRYLELSRVKYERLEMPHQSAIAELEIADIYAELNLYPEAVESYERLIPVLSKLKLRAEEARARTNCGRVLRSLKRTNESRRQLRRAIQLYELEANPVGKAHALLVSAWADNADGSLAAAAGNVRQAELLLDGLQSPRRSLNARYLGAEIDRKQGTSDLAAFEEIIIEAKRLDDPIVEIAALGSMGKIAAEIGENRLAVAHLRKAVRAIESLRAPLPGEEFRRAVVADKMGPYNDLAQIYISQEKLPKAFQLVERARSRSLDELIGNRAAKEKTSLTISNTMIEIRERLNWNYSGQGVSEADELGRLRSESTQLEKQLAELRRRSQSSSTMSARSGGKPLGVDLAGVKEKLKKRRVLIEFVVFAGEISAFVLTDRNLRYVAAITTVTEVESLVDDLKYQFTALRFGATNVGPFASILKKKTDSILQKLNLQLIEPLKDLIGDRDLVISPAGILNYVPFAALFDGSQYLVEAREIVLSPSARIWLELSTKRNKNIEPAILFGFADESIPLVNQEIGALAELISPSTAFTGQQANVGSFATEAPKAGLLHIACHGQFRPDNPMYSSLNLADGRATVNDIVSMRIRAELVTLSACETGVSKVYPGEEVVGLARGFLAAGASNVILSLWNVNDEAASRLMLRLYSKLQRGQAISASLRYAQKTFIERGEHPYYWAPFILIGRSD